MELLQERGLNHKISVPFFHNQLKKNNESVLLKCGLRGSGKNITVFPVKLVELSFPTLAF